MLSGMDTPEINGFTASDLSVYDRQRALRRVTMDGSFHRALDYRLRRLAKRFGLSAEERDDLEQSAWLEICRAFRRYDSDRSAPSTFARRVVDMWLRGVTRERESETGRHGRRARLVLPHEEKASPSPRPEPSRAASAKEAAEIIAGRLDPELLEIARAVAGSSVGEVAAERGVHRGTVQRRLQRARSLVPELDPSRTD